MKKTAFFLALVIPATAAVTHAEPQATYQFRTVRRVGDLSRVQIVQEVSGNLKFRSESDKAEPVTMTVTAKLAYDEKLLALPNQEGGPIRSVRYYDQARADLKIGDRAFQPALRDERRLIVAMIDGSPPVLFSPAGPLMREELDLVDVQGSSLEVDQLLPAQPVAVGAIWPHSDKVAAALLGLDEVSKNTLRSELVAVKDGVARMELTGGAEGTVDGAATRIELKGKYQFDIPGRRIPWLGLLIRESRKPGDVAGGLEVVARVQMQIAVLDQSPHLAPAALKDLPPEPTPQLLQLAYRSADGSWRITHDRHWYLTADERDTAILRLVEKGQRVAQCNISPLAGAAGKDVSLEAFQNDIRAALDKHFGKFVQAGQVTSAAKYRVYRVIVAGEVKEMPIQWYYYLVTDPQGRQVVFAFTVVRDLVSRFDDADRKLVSTLRFDDLNRSAPKK
jgi:hypothetical protein